MAAWGRRDVLELASVAVRLFEIEQRSEQAAQPGTPPEPEPTEAAPASTESAPPPIFITPDEDIADLVPDYVAARRADVLTVRVLVTADDFSGIGSLGHKMAGSGAGYGLPEVSRIGKVLERAAIRHDAESVRQLIDQLGDYLSRVAIRSADARTPIGEVMAAATLLREDHHVHSTFSDGANRRSKRISRRRSSWTCGAWDASIMCA